MVPTRLTVTAWLLAALLPLRAGQDSFHDALADLEKSSGTRLGVAVFDTGTGRQWDYRSDERFAMASTFKVLLVAAVLARVDAGQEQLDREIAFGLADLLEYAPVTKKHVGEGKMTVRDLCAAAIELSDNTAANLLLASVGGPEGLTSFLRGIGDPVTRLDRNEPTLNENLPGDPRDTTTPPAMAQSLNKLLVGDALSAASRQQLIDLMVACQTGTEKLRAGFPAAWKAGDKTGSAARGGRNDVAIFWPGDKPPVIVVAFTVGEDTDAAKRNALFAAIARAAVKQLGL